MGIYYSGNLPQGASIAGDLDPRHYYTVGPSKTLCFPFKMRRYYQQLVIDAADTTPFESCFIPVIRCWASREAAGISMSALPNTGLSTVNIGPNGCLWNFYLFDVVSNNQIKESFIRIPIRNDETYWFMVQNLQNKPANFFLRFTFHGNGITHVE
jgi:hypothetical protein